MFSHLQSSSFYVHQVEFFLSFRIYSPFESLSDLNFFLFSSTISNIRFRLNLSSRRIFLLAISPRIVLFAQACYHISPLSCFCIFERFCQDLLFLIFFLLATQPAYCSEAVSPAVATKWTFSLNCQASTSSISSIFFSFL